MSPAPIELPLQLQDRRFRFIKLGDKGQRLKAPIEVGWNISDLDELKDHIDKKAEQWDADEASGKHATLREKRKHVPRRPEYRGRLNNYSYDDPELKDWLKRGRNYGVTGEGDLTKLESDDIERWKNLGIMALLPETFIVQSSKPNRQHFYYRCPNVSDSPLFDPETKEDIGHIRGTGDAKGRGGMVVGPGSLHPSGVRYKVIKDVPIASLPKEVLEKIKLILSKPITHSQSKRKDKANSRKKSNKQSNKTSRDYNFVNDLIKIKDIAMPANPIRDDGTEIQGSHPLHGSETGSNFSINTEKNVWHCFRCESGGGPLEWIAVEAGLINCSDARPGCLRGELFKQVLDIAREQGYQIPDHRQSGNQFRIIGNRIELDGLPEVLPAEPVVVVKGPPRIGKTHWSIKQLIKGRQGNYITHRHSIVQHAIETFRKQGGQYAVWLEGKHRKGLCKKGTPDCKDCEYYPGQLDYLVLKETAHRLLKEHKILTKAEIPLDLCPYYTLKFAEEEADYCFTVAHFINDIQVRPLTVLDEDPTLTSFYLQSIQLFGYKKLKNKYAINNTLGENWGPIQEIRDRINRKSRQDKVDKLILKSIDQLESIKDAIDSAIQGKLDIDQCCKEIIRTAESNELVDHDIANKAMNRLERFHNGIDRSSDYDMKSVFQAQMYPYKRRPAHKLSSGGSGYNSLYLIGDAISPVINMKWADTARESGNKILIIGSTRAELFANSLGNAVIIEIPRFKYAKNYILVIIDSSTEDTYRGAKKNERLKIRKLIKAIAGDPDSKSRRPILALVGSKEHQDWLLRSLGGIAHPAQEEGEKGQQWNHLGGYVIIFTQNSTMSRGLDMDQYNVICVHDADFAEPFWSAAKEAGEENAEAILDSILMDETTNSVLRISPVVGHDELRPKVVIISENDRRKVKYLDEQVLGGTQGGRTPNIDDIARLIVEDNLTGTVQLDEDGKGISSYDKLSKEWEEAVKNNKAMAFFRLELERVKDKGSKNALIRPALGRLYYKGKIENNMVKKRNYWNLKSQIADHSEVLPAIDSGNFEAEA